MVRFWSVRVTEASGNVPELAYRIGFTPWAGDSFQVAPRVVVFTLGPIHAEHTSQAADVARAIVRDCGGGLHDGLTLEPATAARFQVLDHGEDGSQYFSGCGVTFTGYTHVATGVGDTAREALEDAAEQMAMSGHRLTDAQEDAARARLSDLDRSASVSVEPCCADAPDCDHEPADWNHYVSIRYTLDREAR
jgi:hypothetical protein